jgi:hypothetical protein
MPADASMAANSCFSFSLPLARFICLSLVLGSKDGEGDVEGKVLLASKMQSHRVSHTLGIQLLPVFVENMIIFKRELATVSLFFSHSLGPSISPSHLPSSTASDCNTYA